MPETHRNQFLFSNRYLNCHLPKRPEWQENDAERALREVTAIWERFTPRAGDAAHTESKWVRPVLHALGYTLPAGRSTLETGQGTPPAYTLHAGGPQDASAVIHIRSWDRRLDQPSPVAQDSRQLGRNVNPAFEMRAHMAQAGLRWGILTNGRLSRLYHRDTAGRLDVYYEVNLPALIELGSWGAGGLGGGDAEVGRCKGKGERGNGEQASRIDRVEAFKYFYLFFGRGAFAGAPCWLDEVLAASGDYKHAIRQRVKEQTRDALRLLAQGFLDFPGNDLSPSQDTLKAIHANSLITLYWSLFTLYAESRGLLPVDRNLAYTDSYSLHALTRRIAGDIDRAKPAVASMDELWSYLRRLWRVLDTGNRDLEVPAHPGSLFDLTEHRFLQAHRIGDTYLRQALDLLAHTDDPIAGQRIFIDYGDLEIRHLGSIYESLLAYKIEIGDQRPVIDAEPSQSPPLRRRSGQVSNLQYPISLIPHTGSRKSSGSYYTPDHIVQWLVERTLEPVLDDVCDRHVAEQAAGVQSITTSRQALIDDVLSVKVLDPAMGSGHFLVEATNYIARYLVALGLGIAVPSGGAEGRRSQAPVHPRTSAPERSELSYWRRRVAQSCIYGVDADPLAVELAKLSLWATTAVHGKPLSFLDHHLRCGDSLIGVRMAELHLDDEGGRQRDENPADQLSMLDHPAFAQSMQTATGFMARIQALDSATPDDVREAGHLYHDELRAVTERYRLLADIWTARFFGLQVGSALWSRLIPAALEGDPDITPHTDIIQHAQHIAERRCFFHWELEFPEVFFEPSPHTPASSAGTPSPLSQFWERGEGAGGRGVRAPGFDVIIGNPPYLFGENVPADVKPFLRRHYDLATGQFDAYWLFYERSFWLLRDGGRHGFIVPDAVLARDEVEILRTKLLTDHRITAIAPVGQVFDDPGVGAALVIWEKSPPDDGALDVWQQRDDVWHCAHSLSLATLASTPGHRLLIDLDPVSLALVTHLQSVGRPLRAFVDVSRGEEAGRRHLRPIEARRAGDTPIVIGDDVAPLCPPEPSHCITDRDIEKERSIYRAGKIVMVKTGRDIVCTIDDVGCVTLQSVYNLNPHPTCQLDVGYLAALLSSSLLSWYLRATVTGYKQVFPQLNQSNVEELPIRSIEFTTPAQMRAAMLEEGKRLYDLSMQEEDQSTVIGFIEHQLAQQPDRTGVVHDLLAWLARQTMALNERRRELEASMDVFQCLHPDAAFVTFSEALAGEIARPSEAHALDNVHHDIDGLRLVETDGGWELQVQLKKRNPDDWQAWQYQADGARIAREWAPAVRLSLSDEKAPYYQLAFEVLAEFDNSARSFPAGYTRTTWQKLLATQVPAFDPQVDLAPLVEQRRRLANLADQSTHTFRLIDKITYRLYYLSDADVAQIE